MECWGLGSATPKTQVLGDREFGDNHSRSLGNNEVLGFGGHQNSGDGDSDLWSLGDTETWAWGCPAHGVGDTHLCSRGSLLSPSTGAKCPQSLGVTRLWGHVRLGGVGHSQPRFPGSLLLPRAGDRPLSLGDTQLCVPRVQGLSVAIELRGVGDSHVRLSGSLLLPRAGDPQILGFRGDPLRSRGFSHLLRATDSCPQSSGDTQLLWAGDSRALSLGDIQVLGFGDPRLRRPRPVLLRCSALVCPLALGTPL